MPLTIETPADQDPIDLEDLASVLHDQKIDTRDCDALASMAPMIARLARNRTFLSNFALRELKSRNGLSSFENAYNPQSIMLVPRSSSDQNFYIRANFWPSKEDHLLRAGQSSDFLYESPHDHSFNFLTVGYLGPGYRSRYFEYDYEKVHGFTGEKVPLRFVEESSLHEGKVMLYRAFQDVHDQYPGSSMSISLNIMEATFRGNFADQYGFDVDKLEVSDTINRISASAFLPILAAVEEDNATDYLTSVAQTHICGRVRCIALDALASNSSKSQVRSLYERAASSSHGQVSGHSYRKLELLDASEEQ